MAKMYQTKSKDKKTIKYLQQGIKYFIEDNYILETYYISKLIDIPNDSVEIQIDEYIQKHSNIVKEYKDIFSLKEGNNNLLEFKEKYQEFNLL